MKAKSEEFTEEELKTICSIPTFDPIGATKYTDDFNIRQKAPEVFKFATIEDKCIKIWRYEDGLITTTKRINVKQKLADAVSSEIIGFLVILSANGKVLILNSDGEYVSSIERSDIEF